MIFKNPIESDPEVLGDPDVMAPEIIEQFDKIFSQLAKNTELENIVFTGSYINAHYLEKLSACLIKHANLKTLSLEYNHIDMNAMVSLKKIIKTHANLTHISLDFNRINDAALKLLAMDEDEVYLRRLKEIEFRFYDNQITEQGLNFVLDKLSPDSLRTIVSFNKVDESKKDSFREKIKAYKTLAETNQALAANSAKSPLILSGSTAHVQTKKDLYEQEEKTQFKERKSPTKK